MNELVLWCPVLEIPKANPKVVCCSSSDSNLINIHGGEYGNTSNDQSNSKRISHIPGVTGEIRC